MSRRPVFPLLALVASFGCRAATPPPLAAEPQDVSAYRAVPIGLCEDHPPESTTEARLREDFATLQRAGVRLLRVSFGWDDLEPERDRYDFGFVDQTVRIAEELGIRLIPYVCYTPPWLAPPDTPPHEIYRSPPTDVREFEQLMALLAERYRGRLPSWELWNEPDNREYWTGSAAEYASLLAAGARGVRRGDPGAQVVLGGIAGHLDFLEELLTRHGVARDVDVVNLHSYAETWNAEPLEGLTTYLRDAARLVREHGEAEPLWLAEVGYSSFRRGSYVSDWYSARFDFEHTPTYQASVLLRVLALARSVPEIALIAWYELRDLPPGTEVIGDQNNRHLGVLDASGQPKPALHALARAVPLLSAPLRPLTAEVRSNTPAVSVEVTAFESADRHCIAVLWLPTQRLQDGSTRVDTQVRLAARTSRAHAHTFLATSEETAELALAVQTPILTSSIELSAGQTRVLVVEDCGR